MLSSQVSVVGRRTDGLKTSCPSPGLAGATCVLLGTGLRKHGDFFSPPPTSVQCFGERSQVTDLLEQPPISQALSIVHGYTDALPSTPHAIKKKKRFCNVCAFDLLKIPLASPLTKFSYSNDNKGALGKITLFSFFFRNPFYSLRSEVLF